MGWGTQIRLISFPGRGRGLGGLTRGGGVRIFARLKRFANERWPIWVIKTSTRVPYSDKQASKLSPVGVRGGAILPYFPPGYSPPLAYSSPAGSGRSVVHTRTDGLSLAMVKLIFSPGGQLAAGLRARGFLTEEIN